MKYYVSHTRHTGRKRGITVTKEFESRVAASECFDKMVKDECCGYHMQLTTPHGYGRKAVFPAHHVTIQEFT